ncbi:transposase [Oligoflexus tunisiensis]|uniref:transposase n=1 Tax=Oligoflexus tunisiensis TaxID=708132 RepID=UPI00350E387F
MESLVPTVVVSPKGGRPPIRRLRRIADGIFYKLRTGCQWNAMPPCFGSSSTVHRYFQKWV